MSRSDYLDWEKSTTRTVVHVVQIERGDGSAANRLTLTDKPYYDKGVSGSKYHDTYPAPFQCIVGDLEADVDWDGNGFSDIVISNQSGKFDTIETDAEIAGQSFVVYRGDQSWSLLEEDFPNRFIEVYRGRVNQVHPIDGGKRFRIKVQTVAYDLQIRVGFEGFPRAYGSCFQIPFQLIDSANHDYKCTSYSLRSGTDNIDVFDKGVELTHPDDGAADYTIVTEAPGSLFYGKVRLGSPPTGKVTAAINMDYGYEVYRNVRWIINYDAVEDYPVIDQSIDLSASAESWCMVDGEERYYSSTSAAVVDGTTLGTVGDLSTGTDDGTPKDLSADWFGEPRIWVNNAETRMYAVGTETFLGDSYLKLYDFGTDANCSTLTLQGKINLTDLGIDDAWEVRANDDEDRVWVMTINGTLHQLDIGTVGDITTAEYNDVSQSFKTYDRLALAFDIADGGKRLYVTGDGAGFIWQFRLLEADNIEEIYFEHRSMNHTSSVVYIDPFHVHIAASSVFVFNGSFFVNKTDFVDGNYTLPRNMFLSNVYNVHADLEAGVFYDSPTPISQAIDDLLKSIAAKKTTDRFGQIFATQLKDPELAESFETTYPIKYGDFIGKQGDYIETDSVKLPARQVSLRYQVNFAVQSESELAGAVSEDNKALYSRRESQYIKENILDAWQESEDIAIEGFMRYSYGASQDVADSLAALTSTKRKFHTLRLNLRSISLLDNFGLGSILKVEGDWKHPDFSDGDKLLVVGERINFTQHQRILQVFH